MRRSRVLGAIVPAILVGSGCAAQPFPPPDVESFVHSAEAPLLGAPVDSYLHAQVRISSTDQIDHVLAVRLAASEQQRSQGLQGVRELPTGTGLLLVFDEPEHTGGITTGGVQVVLDMAFIEDSGEIISVFSGNPCRSRPCTVYDPERAYRAVLQVPIGWLSRRQLGAGDMVSWQVLFDEP